MKRAWIVAAAPALLALALTSCSKKRDPKQAPLPPDLTPAASPARAADPERAPAGRAHRAAARARFRCPDCNKLTLAIGRTLRLRPDGHSDELALQSIACSSCAKRGVAAYAASRHGSRERQRHQGAWLSRDDHAALRKRLDSCPAKGATGCSCEAHERYYQLEGGSWKGLRMFTIVGEPFHLQLR